MEKVFKSALKRGCTLIRACACIFYHIRYIYLILLKRENTGIMKCTGKIKYFTCLQFYYEKHLSLRYGKEDDDNRNVMHW